MQLRFERSRATGERQGVKKKLEEETAGMIMNGKYTEGGHRTMKIRFRAQTRAEDTLPKSWKLCIKHRDKKDMSDGEGAKENEMIDETKEKNVNRG